MKLFQQLLVAPAALGLMAPMAATAADLNIDGVSDYSASSEQVSSISQFSDVHPNDWAYQALSSLVERYGCLAGDASGSFRGNEAMTRYEAAALLNACLDNVVEMTDDVRRLSNEFAPELAVLKGRIDGVEAQVGEMAAGQFSTTTKLSGTTKWVVGSVDNSTGKEATTFNYDTILSLDTSFTGEDLLRTNIRAGNFDTTPVTGDPLATGDTALETAFGEGNGDGLEINRAFYQFPVGDNWTATVGAKVRQDDMLAVWPSNYPASTILDSLTYAGANGAYNLALGAGLGVSYANDEGFSASFTYIAQATDAPDPALGIFSDTSGDDFTAQVAYTADGWGAAAAFTSADENSTNYGDSYGLSAWWNPDETGAIPAISGGFGSKDPGAAGDKDETTWSLGLSWSDAFSDGNTLGIGLGSALSGGKGWVDGGKDPMAYELFYDMAVTDYINITPAIFIVEDAGTNSEDVTGVLVKTTFNF